MARMPLGMRMHRVSLAQRQCRRKLGTRHLPSRHPPQCSVRVRNLYFEPTPLSLLAAVVTEEGRLEPAAIAAAVQERKHQYRTAFQLP